MGSEILKQPIFKGVQGKPGFICWESEKDNFLAHHGVQIATAALLGFNIRRQSLTDFGLVNTTSGELRQIIETIPNHYDLLRGSDELLKKGRTDYLWFAQDKHTIAHIWKPRTPGVYVLVAQYNDKEINYLHTQVADKPTGIYMLLLRNLYPFSLTPLTNDEIELLVRNHYNEIRKSISRPDIIKRLTTVYSEHRLNTDSVIAVSSLHRNFECEELVVL